MNWDTLHQGISFIDLELKLTKKEKQIIIMTIFHWFRIEFNKKRETNYYNDDFFPKKRSHIVNWTNLNNIQVFKENSIVFAS